MMLSTPTKLTINRVLTRAGLGPDELQALGTKIRELAEHDQVGLQLAAFMPHTDNVLWDHQTFAENDRERCDILVRVHDKLFTLRFYFNKWGGAFNAGYQIGHSIENEESDDDGQVDLFVHFSRYQAFPNEGQTGYDTFRLWAKEVLNWASSPNPLCRLCLSPVRDGGRDVCARCLRTYPKTPCTRCSVNYGHLFHGTHRGCYK